MCRVSNHGLERGLGLLQMTPHSRAHVKVDVPLADDRGAFGSLQLPPEVFHHFLQDNGVFLRRGLDLRHHLDAFGVERDIGVLIGGNEVEELESRERYGEPSSPSPPLFAASL